MAVELATAYVDIIPTFGGRGGGAQFGRELSQMADQAGREAGHRAGAALSESFGSTLAGVGSQLSSSTSQAGTEAGRRYGMGLTSALGSSLAGAGSVVAASLSSSTAAAERAGSEAGRAYAQRMATSMGMMAGSQRSRFESQLAQQFDASIPNLFAAMNPAFGQAGEQAARTFGQRFRAGVGSVMGTLGSQGVAQFGSNLTSAGLGMTTAITAPLAAIGVGSTRAAMQFESAFAGVIKTVDATDEELSGLRDGIREMATEIPATREEIAGVAEAAGQLGIATPNILEFTRTMIDLGNATNLTGEQAATTLARFANITQMPQTEFDRLGSTIVALGNNFATTEAEIAELGLRLAGAGNQVGLTEAEILSISTALSSVGIEAEAGGTAFSRVLSEMASAAKSGGDELDAFAKIAGVTGDEFATMFEAGASDALVSFIDGLNQIAESGGNVFAALESVGMGEIRVRDALLRSAGAGDLLKQALEEGSQAWEENTALVKEAEARYATSESRMQIFRNQLSDVGVTLGEAMLPALQSLVQAMGPVLSMVEAAANVFAALPGPVQTTVVALAAVAAAAGPVTFVAGNLVTSVNSIASAFTAAKAAGAGNWAAATRGLQSVGAAAGLATVAVAGFTVAWQENTRQLNEGIEQLSFDDEDILPAFNPEDANNYRMAILGMARSLAELNEAGPQSASDWLLDQVGLFDDAGNRLKVAEANVETMVNLIKSMPVPIATATQAVDEIEEALVRYGLSAAAAEDKVRPLREAIADKEVADRARNSMTEQAAAADGLGDSFDGAADGADGLDRTLARLNRRQVMSAFAFDAASAAADGYAAAVERTTRADNVAAAASGAGRALVGLRDGLRAQSDGADEAKDSTDALSDALDGLRDVLERTDPALSTFGIELGGAAAGADAFLNAIKSSTFTDDLLGSAIGLGTAFREFRKTFRRLPEDFNIIDASMGRYGKRATEAINNTLALGRAAQEYLAMLLRSGKSHDEVRAEANRLRAEYEAMFREMGLGEAQIAKLIETMGLAPDTIETSLELSGLEENRFKLNAYLQLLEGRIPAEIATAVTAAIEAGDLDRASKILADHAASNPMKVPVDPEVDEAAVDKAKAALQPILGFDPIDAALGRYTEEQYAWLDQILQFGQEATRTIGEVFASTGSRDAALAAGRELREALMSELGNIPGLDELITAAGLQDWQIMVGLDEASFAETMFKVNTLLALLEEDLTPEERHQIALELTDDDASNDLNTLMGVLERLEAEPTVHQLELRARMEDKFRNSTFGRVLLWPTQGGLGNVIGKTEVSVGADVRPAEQVIESFGRRVDGSRVDAPIGADTLEAVEEYLDYIGLVTGTSPKVPVDATDAKAVEEYLDYVERVTGTDVPAPMDADTLKAWEAYLEFVNGVQSSKIEIEIEPKFADTMIGRALTIGGTLEIPGINAPRREFGGPVTAGMPYIVGEKRPELFIPDRSGHIVPNLDALEPQDSGRIGEVSIHPTYNEVREAPTPEDLARGVKSELWLAGLW